MATAGVLGWPSCRALMMPDVHSDAMATNQTMTFRVNKQLLAAGAVLTGTGALLTLVGTAIACTALATAGRGWVQSLETAPSERASRALRQAKSASLAASHAGAEAWRASAG